MRLLPALLLLLLSVLLLLLLLLLLLPSGTPAAGECPDLQWECCTHQQHFPVILYGC